jgi:hypothetical protein
VRAGYSAFRKEVNPRGVYSASHEFSPSVASLFLIAYFRNVLIVNLKIYADNGSFKSLKLNNIIPLLPAKYIIRQAKVRW